MSLLLIEIPPRQRPGARNDALGGGPGVGAGNAASAVNEWSYVWSADGKNATRTGRVATALLPKADTVVAVVPSGELSWHALTLPRAPASRMRAVLDGLLEEVLLEDTANVHFALPPKSNVAAASWVAVTDKAWLAAMLTELESASGVVDRVVPEVTPDIATNITSDTRPEASTERVASGHFHSSAGTGDDGPVWLTLASGDGVCQVALHGSLPRALHGGLLAHHGSIVWTASPAAAVAAERWLGANVSVQSEAERLMLAATTDWNLRQFDLAPSHRGMLALRDVWRRFLGPAWRPVRWGLAALVVLNIVGLNIWAWEQNSLLVNKRQAMAEVLRNTHPQVRAVLDAPVQMQRETELLRAASGKLGDGDLEVLLGATANAWPEGMPPLQNLRFENARLTMVNVAFTPAQLAPLRERLLATGFDAHMSEGRVTVARAGTAPPMTSATSVTSVTPAAPTSPAVGNRP